MKQTVIAIMAAAFMTAGVFGQVTSETLRQRPQRVQLSETQKAIGKVMAEDAEIKKIREEAIKSMIKRLFKLGHSKEDAKAVVENGAKAAERFRSGGGRGVFENRRRPNERQGRDEIKAPKNPLTPGWSVKAERKLKRKKAKRDE
jgi:Flp pilus assembly protein TadB